VRWWAGVADIMECQAIVITVAHTKTHAMNSPHRRRLDLNQLVINRLSLRCRLGGQGRGSFQGRQSRSRADSPDLLGYSNFSPHDIKLSRTAHHPESNCSA
jgi:hypothetical protein